MQYLCLLKIYMTIIINVYVITDENSTKEYTLINI